MADTLKPSISLTRTPASGSGYTLGGSATDVTLSADAMTLQKVTIGTTEEALPLGDVATPGVSYFKNEDDTNYVEIGVVVSTVFQAVLKLKPGEEQCFRFAATAVPYARAHTAAVVLTSWINAD